MRKVDFNQENTNLTPSQPINNNNDTPLSRTSINRDLNNMSINTIPETNNSNLSLATVRQSTNEKLPIDKSGNLLVYWIDAIEENIKSEPLVIIYGKIYVPETRKYNSISLVLKNLSRVLYLVPKKKPNGEYYEIEKMYEEFENLRKTKFSYINKYSCKESKRKYCFEMPIEKKEHSVLKVVYDAKLGTIPANTQGETFDYIFGRNSSLLEKVILGCKLKGPCWLKINKFEQPSNFNHTWAKFEINIFDFKKSIQVYEDLNHPAPPLKLLSFSTKTDHTGTGNEILSICGYTLEDYNIEGGNTFDNIPVFGIISCNRNKGLNLEHLSK